ncbi:hypothetical protein BDB01DRAFT_831162 [Pilobolus umbonatus]|nr:hypothetical protein BDB01DRAFT_831162 [Pilobolus umbonatus]
MVIKSRLFMDQNKGKNKHVHNHACNQNTMRVLPEGKEYLLEKEDSAIIHKMINTGPSVSTIKRILETESDRGHMSHQDIRIIKEETTKEFISVYHEKADINELVVFIGMRGYYVDLKKTESGDNESGVSVQGMVFLHRLALKKKFKNVRVESFHHAIKNYAQLSSRLDIYSSFKQLDGCLGRLYQEFEREKQSEACKIDGLVHRSLRMKDLIVKMATRALIFHQLIQQRDFIIPLNAIEIRWYLSSEQQLSTLDVFKKRNRAEGIVKTDPKKNEVAFEDVRSNSLIKLLKRIEIQFLQWGFFSVLKYIKYSINRNNQREGEKPSDPKKIGLAAATLKPYERLFQYLLHTVL